MATLGEPLGEQLLAELPQAEASEVRALVANLEEIDPLEYESVLADLRQGDARQIAREPSMQSSDGVELDPSLLARLESEDEYTAVQTQPRATSSWTAINEADVSTLVEVLSAEQPQTIAVVLARLEPAQAASLISHLHPTMQAEVLTRLSDLDPADEQALQVVESQLASWIEAKQRQKQRMAAGYDLVQRIVNQTHEGERSAVLQQLSTRDPQLAKRLSQASGAPVMPKPSREYHAPKTEVAVTDSRIQATRKPEEKLEPTNSLLELEALDDQALLRALQSVDRDTVMLALAGASEALMKRIVRDLPRRQANQFRQQVRSLGPTRLSDMVAAQQELVRSSKTSGSK